MRSSAEPGLEELWLGAPRNAGSQNHCGIVDFDISGRFSHIRGSSDQIGGVEGDVVMGRSALSRADKRMRRRRSAGGIEMVVGGRRNDKTVL
jgi:hypothetical protein